MENEIVTTTGKHISRVVDNINSARCTVIIFGYGKAVFGVRGGGGGGWVGEIRDYVKTDGDLEKMLF